MSGEPLQAVEGIQPKEDAAADLRDRERPREAAVERVLRVVAEDVDAVSGHGDGAPVPDVPDREVALAVAYAVRGLELLAVDPERPVLLDLDGLAREADDALRHVRALLVPEGDDLE